MNRLFRFAMVGLAALPIALTGCSNEYSATVKYGVRSDPMLIEAGGKLGDERYDPDRPGVLPILKLEDAFNPEHPYYSKKDTFSKVFLDPLKTGAKERDEFEKGLEAIFGTPARPTVDAKAAEIDPQIVTDLKLDEATLAKGSSRYRIHCLHCHGVPGNGRGPTARWINPHPRDFRQGLFKFQSTDKDKGGQYPQRIDLVRTVRNGLEGTAMPSFNVLPDDEIESIVSYVIHLSLRGESEFATFKELGGDPKLEIAQTIKDYAGVFAKRWHSAQAAGGAIDVIPYVPPAGVAPEVALKESVLRGKQIFSAKISEEFKKSHALKTVKSQKEAVKFDELLQKKRAAAKQQNAKITDKELSAIALSAVEKENAFSKEDLAALEKSATEPETLAKAELFLKGAGCITCHVDYGRQARFRFDDWGTLVRPNNFTQGNFRGGRRPVDIYYRIHSGIRGSGMQGFYTTFKDHPQYMWDLVNFVSNVSFPAMRERLDMKID